MYAMPPSAELTKLKKQNLSEIAMATFIYVRVCVCVCFMYV